MYGKAKGFSRQREKSIVKIMRYHPQGTSVIFSGSCVNAECQEAYDLFSSPW